MTRATNLFERLNSVRLSALEDLIAERELESLFLDFKRSPEDGAGRQLATEDNKNLSKSISGFSNSSGGVVIWGVDCRRDVSTGNEVAQKHPLLDAGGFATKIQNAISRTTIPPHPGVQVTFFQENEASPAGYVAVLIPQSFIGPMRSVVTNNYHFRSGSDFGIVPHDVLAGMFGKSPQPKVGLNIASHLTRTEGKPAYLKLGVSVFFVNLGAVIGERPYLSVGFGDFPADKLSVQEHDNQAFSVRRSLLPVVSVVAKEGIMVPPGGSEHICDIALYIPVEQPRGFSLECTLGVYGVPPCRYLLHASLESVISAIDSSSSNPAHTMGVVHLIPQS